MKKIPGSPRFPVLEVTESWVEPGNKAKQEELLHDKLLRLEYGEDQVVEEETDEGNYSLEEEGEGNKDQGEPHSSAFKWYLFNVAQGDEQKCAKLKYPTQVAIVPSVNSCFPNTKQ